MAVADALSLMSSPQAVSSDTERPVRAIHNIFVFFIILFVFVLCNKLSASGRMRGAMAAVAPGPFSTFVTRRQPCARMFAGKYRLYFHDSASNEQRGA